MKATGVRKEKEFEPFDIKISFESKREAEEFYALFCYGPVTRMVPAVDDSAIRGAMIDAHGDTPKYDDAFEVIDRAFKR